MLLKLRLLDTWNQFLRLSICEFITHLRKTTGRMWMKFCITTDKHKSL